MRIDFKESRTHQFYSAFLWCLAIFVAHLYFLYSAPYDLYADEAQYWYWSLTPDWGYFSKPPIVAWLITATTSVCGHGEACVKLASPILHFFTSLVMYGIGYHLFSKRVGFWSAITYATLPGVTLSSYIISTDPPLLFFWSLSFYFLVRALKDWHIKWWILMGITVGFGLLSKYNMIIFFGSLGLYFLLNKENRIYLFSFKFWLSILIAAGVYYPNFLWNQEQGVC